METTKEYGLIVIGTGSAMNIVDAMIRQDPKLKVAVIDKDAPGGICLTRGCIPSKILLYPAELVRTIEHANDLNVHAEIRDIDFRKVMERMRTLIGRDIDQIREGLTNSENIDYYQDTAEFVAPYTMRVLGANTTMKSKMIFLCIGSKTIVPPIKGLDKIDYLTSDSVLALTELPKSLAIVGGGYIAAEYGHFFASMGSKVSIIGRNPRFLHEEEPEVSELARAELAKHIEIHTNVEVLEISKKGDKKRILGQDLTSKRRLEFEADSVLIAAGRGPITDILHPERGGIKTTKDGWIIVNEYLETTQPNVWALGDADGKYLFKHVANYESQIVYYNAVLGKKVKADYHAIPHAVFTYPEVASVGMSEKEAIETYGKTGILIGFERYENTAKGEAMDAKKHFVKIIFERSSMKIAGAHIIGDYASILIQEIINVMYTEERSGWVLSEAIHIHPSLSEVVQRAALSPLGVDEYHHLLSHHHEH
jgi:mycothione reductase